MVSKKIEAVSKWKGPHIVCEFWVQNSVGSSNSMQSSFVCMFCIVALWKSFEAKMHCNELMALPFDIIFEIS
jgi:hypothetical protein